MGWSSEQLRLPRYGTVLARSTYTLILTILLERYIPEKRYCDMILESYTSDQSLDSSDGDDCEALFNAKAAENVVHEVKLTVILYKKRQLIFSMPTGLGVTVSSMEKPQSRLLSVDAHPTKPWIITGHECGTVNVSIQNRDTERLLYSFNVSLGPVYSVKFIARNQWFIFSSEEGLIHVYSYETQEMRKIHSFRAQHAEGELIHMWLAVHPTQPYVMSWSVLKCLPDGYNSHHIEEMRLWDWEKGWKCTQTFEITPKKSDFEPNLVRQIAFDAMETNRFACFSHGRVQVWSLDSPKSNYTLPGDFMSVTFLEFFTRDNQQYLIITAGFSDMTAHIWDVQKENYVSIIESETSTSPVASLVFSHPNLPIVLTPSVDGTCRLWNPKDFRLQGVLDFHSGGDVRGTACLMGSKRRFVIGQEATLTILDIDNGKHQESSQSTDPQSFADLTPEDPSSKTMDLNKLERIVAGIEEPSHLDLSLLYSVTENFSVKRVIGRGGCGDVYKGILGNGVVAIKRLFNTRTIKDKMFHREVQSLIMATHQNIVRFLGYCSFTEEQVFTLEGRTIILDMRERLLCFEFISNGSLETHLKDELRWLEWHTRYEILVGICKGLLYLHKENNIIHMDLKPANILLADGNVPKITDFGLSRPDNSSQAATTTTSRLVSPGYCAPEYVSGGLASKESDIYSLGKIIREVVTGSKEKPDLTKVLRRWRHRWIKSSKDTPLGYQQVMKCLELAERCVQRNPTGRPDISYIINELNKIIDTTKDDQFPAIPCLLEDILEIHPLEIHVPFQHDQEISHSIELINDTDDHIAFKTQASHRCYRTEPGKGIVPPRSKRSVTIRVVQPQVNIALPSNDQQKKQITVRSSRVDANRAAATGVTADMFIDKEGKVVDEVNVLVIYDKPLVAEDP